ncbi:hypothetical protein ABIE78_004672 [Sinorhizobium fredii]|jgi:hypothetical protein|uniref:Uncharacterized protein n=1 Tax=Sinorhizobium fredii (strain USDA 257) TaxID=1185652 RepID=I3X103_SINF2|nr:MULTISPECIES: hypothetical protein [Sinorhizobium]AFL49559.1 hypothetical protein USDA257_c09670 [Sinorhizobium fredii USDA 257]PDT83802.1 hypothetical protein CO676_11290 [Sinorhizobium sp. BJ1]
MNPEKLRKLIEDCRRDLWDYLSSDSGVSDREMIIALLNRLDGPQAKDALGEDADWRPRPEERKTGERAGPAHSEARLRIILDRRAKGSARA